MARPNIRSSVAVVSRVAPYRPSHHESIQGTWRVTANLQRLRQLIASARRPDPGQGNYGGNIVYITYSTVPYAMFLEYGYHTKRGNWIPARPAGTMASMQMRRFYAEAFNPLRQLAAMDLSLWMRTLKGVAYSAAERCAAEWRKNIRAMRIIDTGAYLDSIRVVSEKDWTKEQKRQSEGRKRKRQRKQKKVTPQQAWAQEIKHSSHSRATQKRRAQMLRDITRGGARARGSQIRSINRRTNAVRRRLRRGR